LINTSSVSSNGYSQPFTADDLTRFHPAVQKALQKLQQLRDGISIEPITRKIGDWISPLEQVVYVTALYLKIRKRKKIQIEEQYHVASGGRGYFVDFRFSLIDDQYPEFDPFIAFVECDGRAFHDRTPEELTKDRQRWRKLQRQGGKVYPFSGKELFKNPEKCIIEVLEDLEQAMFARRRMLLQDFL
jgi:hypothetical protein